MLRAAVQKGGVEVVAVNDPFLDVNYMVLTIFFACSIFAFLQAVV